jgi:hypothetical protein
MRVLERRPVSNLGLNLALHISQYSFCYWLLHRQYSLVEGRELPGAKSSVALQHRATRLVD